MSKVRSKIKKKSKIRSAGPSGSPISLLTAHELERIFDDFGSNLSVSSEVIRGIGVEVTGNTRGRSQVQRSVCYLHTSLCVFVRAGKVLHLGDSQNEFTLRVKYCKIVPGVISF